MKATRLFIVFFFLLPFTMMAQQSLLHPDRLWSMVQVSCQPEGNLYSSHYLKLAGDTIIEGESYKKLDFSQDETQTIWADYGGFIRETSDGKVYYRRSGLGEGLIYDFSAELGDTVVVLNHDLFPQALNMVVIQEDSLYLEDGWHRMLVLEDDDYPGEETWIEGVGSISGIVKSCQKAFGSSCGDFELLCSSDAGTSIYVSSNYPSCWYVYTRIDDFKETNPLKLYPNPVQNVLHIEGDFLAQGGSYLVRLLDYTGRLVLEEELNSSELDLSTLGSGMYIIQLQINSASYSGKIVKY